ncbi:MAG TPA: zinc metalloprotease HtpX [Gemmatimonadales bacterium]|nr:zinc metalloprotease HtpX [Gemmatimonadales bacterium]
MRNLKVFILMAGLTALLLAIGQAVGGQSGVIMALVIAGVMNFVAYFASAQIALRSYGARIVTAQQAPRLYAMVDRLRQRAALPMPTVAIAPHAQPNAFATGRNPEHAVVCVTQGLLDTVNEAELEGVIAHELAHIQHRDMLLMTVTATLAAAISHLAYMAMFVGGRNDEEGGNPIAALAMMILAPIAAMLIQFAIGRQREFKADAGGAQISGQPLALASALKKLDAAAHRIPMRVEPAMAPLAQVNPLAAHGRGLFKLFSTHPSTAERVARLERLVFDVQRG